MLRDVTPDRLHALLSRLQPHIPAEDSRELQAIIDTLIHVAGMLEQKRTSIRVLATAASPAGDGRSAPATGDGSSSDPSGGDRRKGHGRHGAASYVGGRRIAVPHPTLTPGDRCPEHAEDLKAAASAWMPWTYRDTLEQMRGSLDTG